MLEWWKQFRIKKITKPISDYERIALDTIKNYLSTHIFLAENGIVPFSNKVDTSMVWRILFIFYDFK